MEQRVQPLDERTFTQSSFSALNLSPGLCLTQCPPAEPSGSISPGDEPLASCMMGECAELGRGCGGIKYYVYRLLANPSPLWSASHSPRSSQTLKGTEGGISPFPSLSASLDTLGIDSPLC